MNSKLSPLKKRIDVLESKDEFAPPAEELVINALSNDELDLVDMFRIEHRTLRNSGFSDLEAIEMIKDRMGSEAYDSAMAIIAKADRKYKYLTKGL